MGWMSWYQKIVLTSCFRWFCILISSSFLCNKISVNYFFLHWLWQSNRRAKIEASIPVDGTNKYFQNIHIYFSFTFYFGCTSTSCLNKLLNPGHQFFYQHIQTFLRPRKVGAIPNFRGRPQKSWGRPQNMEPKPKIYHVSTTVPQVFCGCPRFS